MNDDFSLVKFHCSWCRLAIANSERLLRTVISMNKSLYSYNKVIFQTCASKELRILVLSADYQFDVICNIVLNNLGSGYMIRLSRDELIGGIILRSSSSKLETCFENLFPGHNSFRYNEYITRLREHSVSFWFVRCGGQTYMMIMNALSYLHSWEPEA